MVSASSTSRRGLILGTLALAGAAWAWQRFGVRQPDLAFSAIDGLPGWRRVDAGPVTGVSGNATSAVFIGIGDDDPVEPLAADRLCDAVFRGQVGEGTSLAFFTDAFCPYCRLLAPRLMARETPVVWHELPLLGSASTLAARAGVAADLQGGHLAFQTRLMAAPFRPSPPYLEALARDSGLDGARLLADMEGPEVAQRLNLTRKAATTLGIHATPALVIGRTVAFGNLDDETLDHLIALENARTGDPC